MERPTIVIEHLEDEIGTWLLLEYRHVSLIHGRRHTIFTNIPSRYHDILKRYGYVYTESIVDLVKNGVIPADKIIVLDPIADRELSRKETMGSYIVIGGILGDHPPKGRTWSMLTSRLAPLGVEWRNIGKGQYSIDGAAYYVFHLWRHGLKGYRYIDGVNIKTSNGYIRLPFRYPVVDGKPLLAPGLIEYLTTGRIPRELVEELELPQ